MKLFNFKAKTNNQQLIEALQIEIEKKMNERRQMSLEISRMDKKLAELLSARR